MTMMTMRKERLKKVGKLKEEEPKQRRKKNPFPSLWRSVSRVSRLLARGRG